MFYSPHRNTFIQPLIRQKETQKTNMSMISLRLLLGHVNDKDGHTDRVDDGEDEEGAPVQPDHPHLLLHRLLLSDNLKGKY